MNIQSWCCLGLTGLISCSPVDSQESSLTPQFKSINDLALSLLYGPSKHDYWKTIALTVQTFVGKVMFLVFNMLSRFITAFLPRSKCLLISWLQSPSVVEFGEQENKASHVSIVSPSVFHEVVGPIPWSLYFECWVLSHIFHSPLSLSSRGLVSWVNTVFRVKAYTQMFKARLWHKSSWQNYPYTFTLITRKTKHI